MKKSRFFSNIYQILVRYKAINYVLIFISLLLGLYSKWFLIDIVLFTILITLILYLKSSQAFTGVALLVAGLIPVLLIAKKLDEANHLAAFLFYLIALAIINLYFELKKLPSNEEKRQRK